MLNVCSVTDFGDLGFLNIILYLASEQVWTVLAFVPERGEKKLPVSLVCVAVSIILNEETTDFVNFFRILKKLYPKHYSSSSIVYRLTCPHQIHVASLLCTEDSYVVKIRNTAHSTLVISFQLWIFSTLGIEAKIWALKIRSLF